MSKINRICPNCNKEIQSRDNRTKFCSQSCSATYNNKKRTISTQTKDKIKKSIISFHKQNESNSKICIICNNSFKPQILKYRKSRTNTCSKECLSILRSNNSKAVMKKLIDENRHQGWTSRNTISYPEKFFIDVLNNNDIKFIHNYKVKKSDLGLNDNYNYFLDFYLYEKNIDLEIDGKQHNERLIQDELRDFNLKTKFNIYRIKWKSINTQKGKEYIRKEIENFLIYYNNLPLFYHLN